MIERTWPRKDPEAFYLSKDISEYKVPREEIRLPGTEMKPLRMENISKETEWKGISAREEIANNLMDSKKYVLYPTVMDPLGCFEQMCSTF